MHHRKRSLEWLRCLAQLLPDMALWWYLRFHFMRRHPVPRIGAKQNLPRTPLNLNPLYSSDTPQSKADLKVLH